MSKKSLLAVGERALASGILLAAMRPPGLVAHDRKAMMALAAPALCPRDRELLALGHWPPELVAELAWQCESLHVLLWATGRHPQLRRVDQQVDADVIVAELNVMAEDPSAWLASLAYREDAELEAMDGALDLWLWRVRDAQTTRGLSAAARAAIEAALLRGVVTQRQVREGDLVAFGRPFSLLPADQQRRVADIVTERVRAMRWLLSDFDDWWQPTLDS